MIVLGIDGNDYRVFEDWNEITVKKARELNKLSNTAPEDLLYIYKERAKGVDADEDQINLRLKSLESKQKELDAFYFLILECLSDIPLEVISKIDINDLRACYETILMPFVFGVLHFPLKEVEDLESFEIMGTTYYRAENKVVMGYDRPMANECASVFCDASDLDSASRQLDGGKYEFAELITSIVYRESGVKYEENTAYEIADLYKDILTCDIYHSVLLQMAKTNNALKDLNSNLYQGGEAKQRQASNESGLSDFGWFNSIMTVAEMGVLNKQGLTPLDSVRDTNLYDMMTVLSNLRANSDFRKIFSEKMNKK